MKTKTILIGGAVVVVGYLAYQRYMAAQAAAQTALPDYTGSGAGAPGGDPGASDGSYSDGSGTSGAPGSGSGYMQPMMMQPPPGGGGYGQQRRMVQRHPGQWLVYGRHPNQYARRHPNRADRWGYDQQGGGNGYDYYGDGGGDGYGGGYPY